MFPVIFSWHASPNWPIRIQSDEKPCTASLVDWVFLQSLASKKNCFVHLGLKLPSSPSRPGIPGVPSMPRIPFLPGIPSFPLRPGMPSSPGSPGIPERPFKPGHPERKINSGAHWYILNGSCHLAPIEPALRVHRTGTRFKFYSPGLNN